MLNLSLAFAKHQFTLWLQTKLYIQFCLNHDFNTKFWVSWTIFYSTNWSNLNKVNFLPLCCNTKEKQVSQFFCLIDFLFKFKYFCFTSAHQSFTLYIKRSPIPHSLLWNVPHSQTCRKSGARERPLFKKIPHTGDTNSLDWCG